jgi:hypothetical protein
MSLPNSNWEFPKYKTETYHLNQTLGGNALNIQGSMCVKIPSYKPELQIQQVMSKT